MARLLREPLRMDRAQHGGRRIVNKSLAGLTGVLCLTWALGAFAQDPSAKKLFCWTENGRKVCGDALPASAVDSARTEISGKSGLRVGGVDRALSPEEQAQRDAEQKRQTEATAAAEAARRRDLALAESYTSEEELRRAYKIRYDLIDESIKSSRLAIGNLHQSLLRMLEQAGERELSGQPVPKAMADNILKQREGYQGLQAGYRQQLQDRAAIDQQLQEAVARYRDMKAPKADDAPQDGGAGQS